MALKLESGASFGQVHETREVNGLIFAESVYPPGFETEMHEHSNPFFAIVLAGAGLDRSRYWSGYGDTVAPLLVAYPAGEEHASRWGPEGGASFRIEVAPARLEQLRGHASVLTRPSKCRGGLPIWLVGRLHREYRRSESLSPLVMESLALELLVEMERAREGADDLRKPAWLRRVRELLHDGAAEPLSLGRIATEMGVDPSQLTRTFRRYYGCTPGDYLRRLRTESARRILRDAGPSIEAIALTVGFSGTRDLVRAFRREYRITPAAFRASLGLSKSGVPKSKLGPLLDAPRG